MILATQEKLGDKYVISVWAENGWVRHMFESLENLEKYETKCYNQPVRFSDGQSGV